MLPNLIIIGAAKAGTTSLHYYLGLHPEIAMSRVKELWFFSHDERWVQGADWYASQFRSDARIRGEASPSYTSPTRFPHAAERMHAVVPDARLIYIVRDPIARAVSHYNFVRNQGRESRSIDDALSAPDSRYVIESQYWMQLERYLQYFDASRILVMSQHDLARDVRAALEPVYRFLELESPPPSRQYEVRLNESNVLRATSKASRALARLNDTALVQKIPMAVRLRVGRLLYLPFQKPPAPQRPSAEVLAALKGRLARDAARFRAFTGRSFPEWSI